MPGRGMDSSASLAPRQCFQRSWFAHAQTWGRESCLPLLAWWDGFSKSLSDQLPPDLLMSLELARVHPFADLVAMVAKRWTALDEEIDHVLIEREQGITPLTFSFEHDSLTASSFDDLADWRITQARKIITNG